VAGFSFSATLQIEWYGCALLGPLHAPTIIVLYPIRFVDPLTGKWIIAINST
jgi:hypothetical protein